MPNVNRSAADLMKAKPQLAAVSEGPFIPILQRNGQAVGGYLVGGGKTFRRMKWPEAAKGKLGE